MRFVVLGAGGGVGRQVVDAAAATGHEVVAGARSEPKGLPAGVRGLSADVRKRADVVRALDGADAVLWCVGVTTRSGADVGRVGLPHVVAAARQHGVRRLVSVSGAGADLPGDTKGLGARLASRLTHTLGRDLVVDKEGEHAVLDVSELAWTQVRPPRLTEAVASGAWALTETAPGLTARPVPKADVAAAMLHLAVSQEWVRRAPFVVVEQAASEPASGPAAGSVGLRRLR